MNGSLQLKRGKWHCVIPYKDDKGEYKYKWISTGLTERGNKKAAKEILEREIEKLEKELTESKNRIERRYKPKEVDKSIALMLFSDYCDKYVDSIKDKISKHVYRGYKRYIKRIREFFDEYKLRLIDITDEELNAFNAKLKADGLKNVSIRDFSNVLRPALRQARRDKLIPDNPYEVMPSLERERPNITYYDKKEMSKLFEVVEGDRFELVFKMAGYYGLRRSELLGLRWSAIDFEHKTICINHKILVIGNEVEKSDKLKTKSSRRTLPLLQAIEKLLIEKREEIEDNKRFYGQSYNKKYLDYVFVDESGKLIFPDTVSRGFKKILKDNNLKDIRFHDLRHSCASILLASGIQMKQIQEWLGHSHYSTTADVYSHLDFTAKVQSGNVIAEALDDGKLRESSVDIEKREIKRMIKEMKELGFDDVDEYFNHVMEQSNHNMKPQKDHCM